MILPDNTRLQNRYVIVRLLGKGGFGAVYEAKDERLGHRVALKQLTLAGPQVLKAFEREARILARLKHAALPKVSDYFVYSNDYFLVMEYIEGDDLKMLLERQTTPLRLSDVLSWADQLLDALSYLHSQQPPVIHRDIKPGNIKLSPQGKVYLLDFGISKGGQTHTYQAMSGASLYAFSQHYASMEQIEGQGTDARSDLYSLAVTLHHLLTNQKPPQTVSRANAKLMNKPDPLRSVNELNPQVSASVAQVLTRALNFDPNLRPQSASAMQKMLKEAIIQRPAPPPPPPPQVAPSSSFLRPWLVGVGILLLLVVLVGGSLLFGGAFGPPTNGNEATATEIVVAPVASETPEPTATALATDTPEASATSLSNETPEASATTFPTAAPPPTETPLPPTPELVAGATRIAQKDGMVQVYVPAGDFEMGSAQDDPEAPNDEKPRHTVYLDGFWIDKTEVTNAMFRRFVEETGHQTEAEKKGSSSVLNGTWQQINGANWQQPQGPQSNLNGLEDHPVVQISWNDARAYCAWAERRLPSEAEWEKAAGGNLTEEASRKWPWGNNPPTGELVNFCDQNCTLDQWKDSSTNDDYERTSPVGNYPAGASPYGALDMAGNVWEWVEDGYDSSYYASSPRENPTGPQASTTQEKILRGDSWSAPAANIRVHNREKNIPDEHAELWGFRCASAEPTTAATVAEDNAEPDLGSFSDLYFATSNNGEAQSTFAYDTEEIYAIWSYNGMQDGDTIRRLWYLNEEIYFDRTEEWDFDKYGPSGTVRDVFIWDYVDSINSGQWRLELYVNGEEQLVDEFTVE